MIDLAAVISAIVKMGAKKAWDNAKRREAVIRLLKRFKLDPGNPPIDFDSIYTYTLVEYGVDRPEPILNFFRYKFVREAFEQAFYKNDPSLLGKEAEGVIEWNEETGKLGRIDYDPRREFASFSTVFHEIVDRTRTPAEVKRDQNLDGIRDDIHDSSTEIIKRLDELVDLDRVRDERDRLIQNIPQLNNDKELIGIRKAYLHWLMERNLYLDPRGTFQTQRQVQVKLTEVYISLGAQREETPGEVDRRLLEREQAELEAKMANTNLTMEEVEDQREQLLARLESRLIEPSSKSNEILELADVVNRQDRLVILGDPGSGKSTLLRFLALKHSQALLDDKSEIDSELGIAHFPILIRIADYAEHGMPIRKSLSDYLADYCSLHECPKDGLTHLLATELTKGNCLILLDGLDEIVSADERRDVVQQIEDFVRRHSKQQNCFVVTSRIAGYRSAPLEAPFVHYNVQEMSEPQIHRFLERWCPAVEASQTGDL